MSATLSPKLAMIRFRPDLTEEIKKIRESEVVVTGFTYALAEMANLGATAEQLNGARNIIHIFQNLWDKGEPSQRLPVSELQTYNLSTEALAELAKAKPAKK